MATGAGDPSLKRRGRERVVWRHRKPVHIMKPKVVRKKRTPMLRNDQMEKDSPSRDQNHDESRQNGYDPEIARRMGLKPE